MRWTKSDLERLAPILQQIENDLTPLAGRQVLVLCSAAGELVFRLAQKVGNGKVTGVELNSELLHVARDARTARGLGRTVEFSEAEKSRIPLPDATFDALVSEFIVFPTPTPTLIGQAEMARVLKPGGKMVITDVIITKPIPPSVRDALTAIGLDYLCDATRDDFRKWMGAAGLVDVEITDFTPLLTGVWQAKRDADQHAEHRNGYLHLLQDPEFRLGEAIFYIYVRGNKP